MYDLICNILSYIQPLTHFYIFVFTFSRYFWIFFSKPSQNWKSTCVLKYSISNSCNYIKNGRTCLGKNYFIPWVELLHARVQLVTGTDAVPTALTRHILTCSFILIFIYEALICLTYFCIVIGLCYVNKGSSYHPRTVRF
jgi:hypothetical protein